MAEITASLQAAGLRYTLLGGCTYDLGVYALGFLQRMTGEKPQTVTAAASGGLSSRTSQRNSAYPSPKPSTRS